MLIELDENEYGKMLSEALALPQRDRLSHGSSDIYKQAMAFAGELAVSKYLMLDRNPTTDKPERNAAVGLNIDCKTSDIANPNLFVDHHHKDNNLLVLVKMINIKTFELLGYYPVNEAKVDSFIYYLYGKQLWRVSRNKLKPIEELYAKDRTTEKHHAKRNAETESNNAWPS